jgi:phosphotransferase system enzyme I (PtsI)
LSTTTDTLGQPRLLRGLPVSSGIAIGPAYLAESGQPQIPEYRLHPGSEVDKERARFSDAVAKARRQIRKLKAKAESLPEQAAEDVGLLLDAHAAILGGSRLLRGVDRRIADDLVNAEFAVQAEVASIAAQFAAMDDSYLAGRMDDIGEVGSRLIRNLSLQPYKAFVGLPEGSVVLAEEITPADTALMDPRRVAGFAAASGGTHSHTAVMARSLGLPAVLGVPGLIAGVKPGNLVIIDGFEGIVVIDADLDTLARYEERRASVADDQRRLRSIVPLPTRTRDGVRITLSANIELPRDVPGAIGVGADGIGLLRTEFVFMSRPDLPSEEEQFGHLRAIVGGMGGRPVTIRTADIGADKILPALSAHLSEVANPALGLRAIRLALREPKLLDSQLAAILRVGAHGPIRILLPMITSVAEICEVRQAIDRVSRRLRRRKAAFADPPPPLGAMIEVPAAALIADALAREVDFFAIGTNDLVMYTLAADRGDDSVAGVYDPLHTAVLRLLQLTAEAALRARIPVNVCGEIAGDPRYTALLVGLGLREFSMSPQRLLAVKQRVLALDSVAAARRAQMIMDQTDPGRIAALVDDFNQAG